MDLVDRRKGLGLRQDAVAELIGVSKWQLNRWENGQPMPPARQEQLGRIYTEYEEARDRATASGPVD